MSYTQKLKIAHDSFLAIKKQSAKKNPRNCEDFYQTNLTIKLFHMSGETIKRSFFLCVCSISYYKCKTKHSQVQVLFKFF